MATAAAKALKSVLDNKDIGPLLNEEGVIFGPVYGIVRDYIVDYYREYSAVPPIEVVEDKFGEPGDPILSEISISGGATAHYMAVLKEEYVKMEIARAITKIHENIDSKSAKDILGNLTGFVNRTSKFITGASDVSITDPDKALEVFQKRREAMEKGETIGIATGIEVWDEYMPTGMLPGDSIILFGYSGKMKTWIADLVAANAYRAGKRVMIVSLEMSTDKLRDRVWAIIGDGRFYLNDLAMGNITDDDVKDFASTDLNTGGDIIVVDQEGRQEITPSVVQSFYEKHKPDLIIIDYLQLMTDNQRTKDMTPRMLNLSKDIKNMARACAVPIISISSVTDDQEKKRDSPPQIQQIAWSKGIEYDTDIAIAVHRHKDDTTLLELACRKMRNEDLWDMIYEVDPGRGVFRPKLHFGGENENS